MFIVFLIFSPLLASLVSHTAVSFPLSSLVYSHLVMLFPPCAFPLLALTPHASLGKYLMGGTSTSSPSMSSAATSSTTTEPTATWSMPATSAMIAEMLWKEGCSQYCGTEAVAGDRKPVEGWGDAVGGRL